MAPRLFYGRKEVPRGPPLRCSSCFCPRECCPSPLYLSFGSHLSLPSVPNNSSPTQVCDVEMRRAEARVPSLRLRPTAKSEVIVYSRQSCGRWMMSHVPVLPSEISPSSFRDSLTPYVLSSQTLPRDVSRTSQTHCLKSGSWEQSLR